MQRMYLYLRRLIASTSTSSRSGSMVASLEGGERQCTRGAGGSCTLAPAMELLLIRHALPLRVERDDGAPADPPLAPSGCAQAQRLASALAGERLAAVYASPLRRARETAAPLAAARGLAPRIEPGVVEFDPHAPRYVPLEEIRAESRELWLELLRGGL